MDATLPRESASIVTCARRAAHFDMIFFALESLYRRTCLIDSISADERAFVAQHGRALAVATCAYRADPTDPARAWALIRQAVSGRRMRVHKYATYRLMTFMNDMSNECTLTRPVRV
jgi:hypothetical protein